MNREKKEEHLKKDTIKTMHAGKRLHVRYAGVWYCRMGREAVIETIARTV